MRKQILLFLSIFIIFSSFQLRGQLSGDIVYTYFYDDNPLRSASVEKEFVNSLKSDLNYKLFNRELYLSYSGNYNIFQTTSDRNYQFHSLGMNSSFKVGEVEEKNLFTGLSYNLKKGVSDYKTYDFNQFTAFANGRFSVGDAMFIQPGYTISYKKFPSLSDLTHFENLLSSQFSMFFETGTGIFVEGALGNKYYSYTEETTTPLFNNIRHGKDPWNNPPSAFITTKSQKAFNVVQFRAMLKISQSIFENTGVNGYYLSRLLLTSGKNMFQSSEFIYSGDDELWDDPYGFSSNEYGAGLTQKLPFDITLKLNAQYSNRHYTNNISDTLNITQRIDGRFELWGGISKTINELPLFSSMDLTLEYMFINNTSNVKDFGYKNNMAMFGLQFSF